MISNLTTVHDAAGLPTSASDAVTGESVTYTHDAVGNLTKIDSSVAANDWAHTYDAYSRLTCSKQATSCTSGTARVLLSLDALDRTVTRTTGGTSTTSTYQGASELLAKTVAGATTSLYAFTAGGAPLAQQVGSVTSFGLRDPHGDVVGLVSTSAGDTGTSAFDPWGKVLGTSGTQGLLGYQGDPTDAVTAQVDMGTRWYSPGLGRFSTRDVLAGDPGNPISVNQHLYGAANPVTMIDPTGMRPTCSNCSARAEKRLVYTWSVGRSTGLPFSTVWGQSGAAIPAPPPPEPAPPVDLASLMSRKGGASESVSSACARRCGVAMSGYPAQTQAGSPLERATCSSWLNCRWHNIRDASHDVTSFAYRVVASASGATCIRRDAYWGCTGGDAWVTGFGHATTIGDTVVSDDVLEEDSGLLRHELEHVKQSKNLGPLYIPLWGLGNGISAALGEWDGSCNPMELLTDASSGTSGYLTRCG